MKMKKNKNKLVFSLEKKSYGLYNKETADAYFVIVYREVK